MEGVTYSVTYWVATSKQQAHHIMFSDLNKAREWANAMSGSDFYVIGGISKVTTITEEVPVWVQ